MSTDDTTQASEAGRLLGRLARGKTSARKKVTSAANLAGYHEERKQQGISESTRAKLRAAQQLRREREREAHGENTA